VDILLEDAAGHLVGLEVKTSATVVRKDFSGFDALSEDTGRQFVRGNRTVHGGDACIIWSELHGTANQCDVANDRVTTDVTAQ
jgi:hypothetical protein